MELKFIPVSNNTIHRRIKSAAQDIKEQLVARICECKQFAIQLDESTDVAGKLQLMTYVRYLWLDSIEEDRLFCHSLPTNTTSEEIFKRLNDFMTKCGIDWTWCYGVCTDGVAAMTGKKAGVWAKIRAVASLAKFTHCMIHRESLANKSMCADLKTVFDQAIKVVNFIKSTSTELQNF